MSVWINLASILVAVLASVYFTFHYYPSPPISPILYQWQNLGNKIKYKDFNIFYIDNKIREGTNVLLCLHGYPTSSFDFYKIWPKLNKQFDRIIFIDFLGLGFSDKPIQHHYSIFEQADIVEFVLKSLEVDNINILSHDYGDTVTQELMARTVEGSSNLNIKSVTMLNGGIFPSVYRQILIQRILRFPIIGYYIGLLTNSYLFEKSMRKLFGVNTYPSVSDIRDFWAVIRMNDGYKVLSKLLHYVDERYENEDRWVSVLRSFRKPLQYIYGPNDPINPTLKEYYYKFVPNPYFNELEKSIGHYPHYEVPEIVANLFFEFLKKKAFFQPTEQLSQSSQSSE